MKYPEVKSAIESIFGKHSDTNITVHNAKPHTRLKSLANKCTGIGKVIFITIEPVAISENLMVVEYDKPIIDVLNNITTMLNWSGTDVCLLVIDDMYETDKDILPALKIFESTHNCYVVVHTNNMIKSKCDQVFATGKMIESYFDMQHDLNKVVLITGKPYTGKTKNLKLFIDNCIKIGGNVVHAAHHGYMAMPQLSIINSIGKTVSEILDMALPYIDDVSLLAIDDAYGLTDTDIIKTKEFAKTHNCQIVIVTSDKFCSEFVDGYLCSIK